MGKRLEIGILYNYTPHWMGGVYYIQNLIYSLNTLSEKEKPTVCVFCQDELRFKELKDITNYPYLKYRYYELSYGRIGWRLLHWQKRISPFHYFLPAFINLWFSRMKFLYPTDYDKVRPKKKILAWIPDFQDKYLPDLFSQTELANRDYECQKLVKNEIPIVFSSMDAKNDFSKFYPENRCRTYLLRFATHHPSFDHIDIDVIKRRHKIDREYLFCANQFWKHKNHIFLFEAYCKAKEQGLNLQLVCSGAISDYRDKQYGERIKSFIQENKLESDIVITGFINREEQLALMKHSYAIVQPSLFEGWSTVVEDAKALNKFIFLSNLRVHIEQAPVNVEYFDPYNKEDLVNKLLNTKPTQNNINYKNNVLQFAKDFISIAKDF